MQTNAAASTPSQPLGQATQTPNESNKSPETTLANPVTSDSPIPPALTPSAPPENTKAPAAKTSPKLETVKPYPSGKLVDTLTETPVVNLTNAADSMPVQTETVPEDKTFAHSMDKSESVTVKGKDLGKTVVIEKYLKTGQTTRVAEKMTGAVVAVHADEFESYMASLKKLGNIETKILHKPE